MTESTAVIGLDPTSGPLPEARDKVAGRPPSLDGAVIGLVANGLGKSEVLMQALYEELKDMADLAGVLPVLKSSVSVPPEPDDWQALTSEVSVAITGFGG